MRETATKRSKSGWTTVALGDVVDIINEYWDRDTTVPERLVAGEHIEEGVLRVRRWAMTDDDLIPPTFNRWFEAGDVLLHSRNIKKVAQPDFRGITGEKLFILRSKHESILLQGLVPFLVQSSVFRTYAESRWAGSTNKFLNKTPLEQFEFALPPIEEQRRTVESLEAVQKLELAIERSRQAANAASRALCEEHFSSYAGSMESVKDLADHISKGESPKWQGFNYVAEGVPFITSEHVLNGVIQDDDCKRIPKEFHKKLTRSHIRPSDVLVTLVGASIGRAAVVPERIVEANTNQAIAVVRFKQDRVLPEYFVQWYLHSSTQRHIAATLVNTARANVSLTDIRRMRMPVPPITVQQSLVEQTTAIWRAVRESGNRRASLNHIKRLVLQYVEGAE
jgi:type I restriction enzyme S subunit